VTGRRPGKGGRRGLAAASLALGLVGSLAAARGRRRDGRPADVDVEALSERMRAARQALLSGRPPAHP
jgi:hypothetical protein